MKAYIVDDKYLANEYLLFFFRSVEKFILSKVRAVTADNIEFKQIKEMLVTIPPLHLQNQFAERIQAIELQKAKAEESLGKAEALFGVLLQRAFKGELV